MLPLWAIFGWGRYLAAWLLICRHAVMQLDVVLAAASRAEELEKQRASLAQAQQQAEERVRAAQAAEAQMAADLRAAQSKVGGGNAAQHHGCGLQRRKCLGVYYSLARLLLLHLAVYVGP